MQDIIHLINAEMRDIVHLINTEMQDIVHLITLKYGIILLNKHLIGEIMCCLYKH